MVIVGEGVDSASTGTQFRRYVSLRSSLLIGGVCAGDVIARPVVGYLVDGPVSGCPSFRFSLRYWRNRFLLVRVNHYSGEWGVLLRVGVGGVYDWRWGDAGIRYVGVNFHAFDGVYFSLGSGNILTVLS